MMPKKDRAVVTSCEDRGRIEARDYSVRDRRVAEWQRQERNDRATIAFHAYSGFGGWSTLDETLVDNGVVPRAQSVRDCSSGIPGNANPLDFKRHWRESLDSLDCFENNGVEFGIFTIAQPLVHREDQWLARVYGHKDCEKALEILQKNRFHETGKMDSRV
ncbi:hypothetical protein Tco_0139574 [Tanacetum coccineum]